MQIVYHIILLLYSPEVSIATPVYTFNERNKLGSVIYFTDKKNVEHYSILSNKSIKTV